MVNFLCTAIGPLPKSHHFMNRFMHTQCSFSALLEYYFLNARMRYSIQSHYISCQNILFGSTYIRIILPFQSVKFHITVVVFMNDVKSYDLQSIQYFFFYDCVNINILDRGKFYVYDQTLTQKAL